MFEYISGTLSDCSPHKITVDVGGIGYSLFIPLSTFEKLPQMGTKVKIYTSTVIREDSHKIFGFLTQQDRDFFEKLTEISGIGPRLALAILGHMEIGDLQAAVLHNNAKAISQIPGIGKKMSERLILELRDKFPPSLNSNISSTNKGPNDLMSDATSALIHLGYSPLDAQKAVQNAVRSQEKPPLLPELISLALKIKK